MPYPQHNSHYGCCTKSQHKQKQISKPIQLVIASQAQNTATALSYNNPSGLITIDIPHRYPSVMLKHVHQICHVILHFFWWDPSAANKPHHLRLFNTLYQEQNLSFILFIHIHPLFLQQSRCSLVMLPPCCCCFLKCYIFNILSNLSHWCCKRRLRKGFLSANYSKPLAGCCCHTLVSSICTTRSFGGHTRGFRYHNCWLEPVSSGTILESSCVSQYLPMPSLSSVSRGYILFATEGPG